MKLDGYDNKLLYVIAPWKSNMDQRKFEYSAEDESNFKLNCSRYSLVPTEGASFEKFLSEKINLKNVVTIDNKSYKNPELELRKLFISIINSIQPSASLMTYENWSSLLQTLLCKLICINFAHIDDIFALMNLSSRYLKNVLKNLIVFVLNKYVI